jgi:methylated-DNA-[protein]-cysteine S-methyltransferase
VLEVGKLHGVEPVGERPRPVVEHDGDRHVVGNREGEVQIGEAVTAVHGERAHGGCGNHSLILLREPKQALAESIPLLDGEHGPATSHMRAARRVVMGGMASRVVDSPIGPLGLLASAEGLTGVRFAARVFPHEGASRILDVAVDQIEAYFAGELTEFALQLDLRGTEFQRRCWLALATIPYGQTVSYGEQARRLGLGLDAARAIGAANGQNPVPLILPCHRVIGADGSLTGFGAGLETKRFLLEHEGALLPLG